MGGGSRERVVETKQDSTTKVELPEWYNNAAQSTYEAGRAALSKPYQAYTGNRVAGLNAFDRKAASGNSPDAYKDWMNPYTKEVVGQAVGEVQRAGDIAGTQIGARAVSGGAFGGSRHGLVESEHHRNIMDKVGQTSLEGYNQGYTNAQKAAFASSAMNQEFANIRRQIEQGGLDANYQEYLRGQDYDGSQAERLMALLAGTPSEKSTSSTGTSTETRDEGKPNVFGQILGGVGAIFSSEDLKENRSPADGEELLTAFRDVPVDDYDYKPEAQAALDLPESRTGPMAQDYEGAFGGQGSDGTMIDGPDLLGKALAMLKALDDRTRHLAPTEKKGTANA